PTPLKGLWDTAPEAALSLSVIAATIGGEIEPRLDQAKQSPDPLEPPPLDAVAREAYDQAFPFFAKIPSEEALEDSCELSPLLPVEDAGLKPALQAMDAQKAGISVLEDGRIAPRFAGMRFCFWVPAKAKGKPK